MTIKGVQAWVTSAVDEKAVTKALVCAASLRQVRTTKKLAVLTTLAVSKDIREKLEEVFDLVVLLEQATLNGVDLEEYAKIQAFSLLVFSKCVYLAPQTLVLKNCDEIFDKFGCFAISEGGGDQDESDTSVYMFTPAVRLRRVLEKIAQRMDSNGKKGGKEFSKYFKLWMQNHVPNSSQLGKEYNVRVALNTTTEECLDVVIANFFDTYPLDFSKEKLHLGAIGKYVVGEFWKLYNEQSSTKEILDLELSSHLIPKTSYETEPIAIVGLDFRLPGGNTPSEFWDLLANGLEGIIPLPPFRWRKDQICTPCKNRKLEAGFLNIPIDEFDAKFFGISPKDAVFLDPQQRLLHEVSWCALEDAALDPHTLHGSKTGIFVGSWIHDYKDQVLKSPDVEFFRSYIGNSIAATAARLSHFLGTTGPSIATESGCSSGIVAVDMACKSLRSYDSDLAFACGVNLLLHPFDPESIGFVFSPKSRCRTFDAGADGFGRAEGCAVLLMKRLSDALRERNKIWGLVRGSAVTQEGVSKSIGTPTVHSESLVMELALKDAGVEAKDVSFVEAHGTGTQVGDPMEIAAISKAYSKGRTDPLIIGSVKTNVGHTESVSGITGIIKVLLSMKYEMIPPHLNFDTLHPSINLDEIPARIPLNATPWPREIGKPRLAGVSSFGISGGDGHVIIEEAPSILKSQIDFNLERPLHIMKVSAKSEESLQKMLETYEKMFREKEVEVDGFADIAYSMNTGRATFNHRATIVASDFKHASDIIKANSFNQGDVQVQSSPICFLFTGQGSQYHNMASSLYESSPVFRTHFDKCAQVLQTRYSIPIKQVLWGSATDPEKLSRTLFSQTSIFCVEYCLLKLWESWGVKPDFVMGHSLGEFAAAVAAGALGFEDALMLVAERSRLIDSLPRGKMLVIRADKKTVDHHIAKYKEAHPAFWADYAALNSSDQTVIAGDSKMIEDFAKVCGEKSLKVIVLAATHAFHSCHMDPMLEEYRRIASSVVIKPLSKDAPKYISGMEGRLTEAQEINADYWVRHTREKVSFMEACKAVHSEGCTLFLEVGPHPVLSALAMTNIDGASVKCLPSLRRKESDWVTILDSLSKLYLSSWKGEINWKGFDNFYPRNKVDLPFYPFNRKPAWIKSRHAIQELHPLLGKVFLNASNQTIFEREMTVKNTNFVQDHVIGSTIVFPGAGFLELALSAGYASVQGLTEDWTLPRRAIGISNLKIAAPLALYESSATILQTVVTLDNNKEEELGYSVAIHRNNDPDNSCGDQWVLHASATFQPVAKINSDLLHPVNIKEIQNTWEKSDRADFYEKLPEVGLRFGPKFQSLVSGWRSESAVLTQVKLPDDHNAASYLIHPVVGDAMLQAIMFWLSRDTGLKRKLQVPVHIGQFTWLASSSSPGRYIYCATNDNGTTYALLVDDEGTPLAFMTHVDFAETNVKLIEGMIQQQSSAMPFLWEEVWKPTRGPLQNQFSHRFEYPAHLPEDTEFRLRALSEVGAETELKFLANVRLIANSFFLEALLKLGWSPELNVPFTLDDLIRGLAIKREHRLYVRFFLRSLALQQEEGIIIEMLAEDATHFRLKALPPKLQILVATRQRLAAEIDTTRVDFRLLQDVGEGLDKFLTGDADPLGILFREDPSKANVRDCYAFLATQIMHATMLTLDSFVGNSLAEAMEKDVEASLEQPVVRILEVGAGTGLITSHYIRSLAEKKIRIEYHYTDISISFFKAGAEKLGDELAKDVIFKKFNMEEDPFEQGFCPGYFDLILACEVLHVSKDALRTLKNLRPLLKPDGVIQIIETIEEDPRLTLVWGLLDGYWRFEDYNVRPFHVSIGAEKWVELLHAAKFSRAVWRPAYHSKHATIIGLASSEDEATLQEISAPGHVWLLFDDGTELTQKLTRKLVGINRRVVVFPRHSEYTEESLKEQLISVFEQISDSGLQFEGVLYLWGLTGKNDCERDQVQISLPLLTLFQVALQFDQLLPRMYALTQGVYSVGGGDSEVLNPACGTIRGLVGAMANENFQLVTIHMDLCPGTPPPAQVEEVFKNCFYERNFTVAFREGKRLAPRFVSLRLSNSSDYLSLPSGCDRFSLQLPETKLISDLEFVFLEGYTLGEFEIEVQVKAYALNFRDLFAVLKPAISVDHTFGSAGLDYSGVVTRIGSKVTKWKVGDRVIAMDVEDKYSLASHMKLSENHANPLPTNMTFAEGSTLPTVFLTSFHCLAQVAQLKRGETVLIHTASGGVGLVALQIAKEIGARIIATAGSQRKRNYLKSLGIEHVFHSRTTEFRREILEVTGGRGVDVVLNSLTGPGFKEASLSCLAKNGRFVEMSKLNVWQSEEVSELRSDALYSIVDLTKLDDGGRHWLREEMSNLLRTAGFLKPIPYVRFDALNIRGALNYLQKARHIGKVVVIMPEVKVDKSKLVAVTPLFNQESTYVVTGGLGGIGFAVVKWMLSNGAKHIATLGRSPPKPDVASEIQVWNKRGKHIKSYCVDVGRYAEVRQVFDEIQTESSGFPQIRGVMHAAGVLRDATIENQCWSSFNETYKSKIDGSWNLHDLTKDLLLEHFVLFSSVSSTFGSPGQANHSASNSFEDTLAFYRSSVGLPATTVNWGNWGEVGVATEVDFPGIRPISTLQGLLALETFLTSQRTHTIVANIESFALMTSLFPKVKYYVDDKRLFGDVSTNNVVITSDELWAAVDGAQGREAKFDIFKGFIKITLRTLLKMDPNEEIDDNVEFQSIGIDSLMMLEMKNGLQNVLGARLTLSVAQLKDCTSTQLLASKLVDILQGDEDKRNLPTPEELRALIREDSKLPEHIVPPAAGIPCVSIDKVHIVLLTGVTGNMGPYFLRDLSRRANIDKIYCLIRKSGKDSASMRLSSRLRKSQLLEEVDMEKVECLLGDMTDPLLGLPKQTYDELAESVDAIVHCAVRADHNAKYWKVSESRKSHVRTANVFGTMRVLEFAVHKKVKHVYHAATLLSVTTTDANDKLLEDWQDVGALDELRTNLGYPISKHVCEQLVQQAIERGIPCKAFRLPFVSGDSRTGYSEYESHHFLLRCLGLMKLGCMPDVPVPLAAIPVDKCVEVSLAAFFDERAVPDVYNVTPRNPEVEQILVPIAKEFGVDIDIIPFEEFISKLKTLEENSPLAPFVEQYRDEDAVNDIISPATKCLQKYLENSEDFFTNRKLEELYPGWEESLEQATTVLRRDLGFLQKAGVFKKFGIETNSEN